MRLMVSMPIVPILFARNPYYHIRQMSTDVA